MVTNGSERHAREHPEDRAGDIHEDFSADNLSEGSDHDHFRGLIEVVCVVDESTAPKEERENADCEEGSAEPAERKNEGQDAAVDGQVTGGFESTAKGSGEGIVDEHLVQLQAGAKTFVMPQVREGIEAFANHCGNAGVAGQWHQADQEKERGEDQADEYAGIDALEDQDKTDNPTEPCGADGGKEQRQVAGNCGRQLEPSRNDEK